MRRYANFEKQSTPVTYRTTIYPYIPHSEDDIYIITRDSDRLDLLSGQYYEDVTLWWVIATANNIGKGTLVVPPGKQLRIPNDVEAAVTAFNEFNATRG